MNIQFKLTILSTIRFILSIIFVNFFYFLNLILFSSSLVPGAGSIPDPFIIQKSKLLNKENNYLLNIHSTSTLINNQKENRVRNCCLVNHLYIERLRNLKTAVFADLALSKYLNTSFKSFHCGYSYPHAYQRHMKQKLQPLKKTFLF